nr:PREDICTED: nidogen-2-like [Bemisia tabaci]
MVTLKGSGTDQSIHLDRWSNTGTPGLWIFRIGNIGTDENAEAPEIPQRENEIETSCATGSTSCHSSAECVDNQRGFCCLCKSSYFGNGITCLKRDIPLRINGKVDFDLNGVSAKQLDLQGYIVTVDGRSYTAISKVPSTIGYDSQFLNLFASPISWLFAKSVNNAHNGYQLTGGVLNYTGDISFLGSGHRVSIRQRYYGMDVFDQLKMDAIIQGNVPYLSPGSKPFMTDHSVIYNRVSPGILRSQSTHLFKFENSSLEQKIVFLQTIYFKEMCPENTTSSGWKVKVARNFIAFEERESILRFASTNKVSLSSESSDPCSDSKARCVANSTCVVEEDTFKCVCNPGFETVYVDSESKNFGCYDINECAKGTDTCHVDAICINEIGSFSCQCKPGFEGDGHHCEEKSSQSRDPYRDPSRDPSRDPNAYGPPNSYCPQPGNLSACSCNQGYLKQYKDETSGSFYCTDIDECSMMPPICPSQVSICRNYPGTYVCTCRPGYTGNGYSCFPLDERPRETCARISCPAGAECVENRGQAYCACSPGYTGDGTLCTPLPTSASCNTTHNCSPYADCLYNPMTSSYECKCLSEFIGDGYNCVDARQIQQSTHNKPDTTVPSCLIGKCWCPTDYILHNNLCVRSNFAGQGESDVSCNTVNRCHSHAQCVYTGRSFQCKCNAGYEGNGFECTKVETSCLDYDQCDTHASCAMNTTLNRYVCVCNQGYEGDGTRCSEIALGACGNCGAFSECVSVEGTDRKECQCIAGYINYGSICQPDTEDCARCHPDAQCVINPQSNVLQCQCLPNFIGDGVNQCEKKPLDCHSAPNCSPSANCIFNHSLSQYKCQCMKGFEGDGYECRPVRTCIEDKSMCSRDASCVLSKLGVFHCECNEGFYGNGYVCKEVHQPDGDFLLLNQGMTTIRLPFNPSKNDTPRPIQLQTNQIAIGITVDCMEGRVYWSDISGRAIKSCKFNGKDVQDLNITDVISPEGLSVDWINRFLYWTDSGKKEIAVVNLDTKQRTTLISSGLVNPRGIAVHPFRQKIFWSDWNRKRPKLEWANLDGSDRAVFLEGNSVVLPNSLAIDWDTDELCWADAGTKSIECASIDSRTHRSVVSNCSYPFGLAITREKYYWTDWILEKVESATRSGKRLSNLQLPLIGNGKLYGITPVFAQCPRS